jgi:transcription elongation factor Elf1
MNKNTDQKRRCPHCKSVNVRHTDIVSRDLAVTISAISFCRDCGASYVTKRNTNGDKGR